MKIAHENYVLPKGSIDQGMADWSINVFDSLNDPHNLMIGLAVATGSLIFFGIYFKFMTSRVGIAFGHKLKKLEPIGYVAVRMALAASFIASAYFNSFLGPEIPLGSIPLGNVLQPVLYICGFLLLAGLYTEIASILGLVVLILTTGVYKDYMITYFNYYGELLALIFFGSRIFSLDAVMSKSKAWLHKLKEWEISLIRITYGISVLYPAITIKILHPAIMVEIAEKYNLMRFHWLFPQDPLLISLGTGIAQIVVGLCIIFGFATRLNSFITFVLYIMSIIFFKEAVWPHYILLALGLYLVINNGGKYSIDNWIEKKYDRGRT